MSVIIHRGRIFEKVSGGSTRDLVNPSTHETSRYETLHGGKYILGYFFCQGKFNCVKEQWLEKDSSSADDRGSHHTQEEEDSLPSL